MTVGEIAPQGSDLQAVDRRQLFLPVDGRVEPAHEGVCVGGIAAGLDAQAGRPAHLATERLDEPQLAVVGGEGAGITGSGYAVAASLVAWPRTELIAAITASASAPKPSGPRPSARRTRSAALCRLGAAVGGTGTVVADPAATVVLVVSELAAVVAVVLVEPVPAVVPVTAVLVEPADAAESSTEMPVLSVPSVPVVPSVLTSELPAVLEPDGESSLPPQDAMMSTLARSAAEPSCRRMSWSSVGRLLRCARAGTSSHVDRWLHRQLWSPA